MGSQITWAPGQYMGAGPTILQDQMRAANILRWFPKRLPCAAHFNSWYILLVMTEANTRRYGKKRRCSYLSEQKRNKREILVSNATEVVDFHHYTPTAAEKKGFSSAVIALLKNISERGRDDAPEARCWFDRQLHRENISKHLKPRNSNKTFRIYQNISLLLFMRENLMLISVLCDIYKKRNKAAFTSAD